MKILVEGVRTNADGEEEAELFTTYTLNEIAEIAGNEMAMKDGSTKPKVSLSFELNRSHILRLTKVSAEIIETKIEEVTPKKEEKKEEKKNEEKEEKKEEETAKEGEDSEKKEESTEEAKSEEPVKEGEDAEKKVEEDPKKEFKTSTVPHTYPCAIKEKMHSVNLLDEE